MPVPVSMDDKRGPSRLTLLFRAGLAVAALAALLLLVANGNGLLRVAAVLAIAAVTMIGLSISLRPDATAEVRQLADEIDELRAELAAVAHSAPPNADPARWPAEPVAPRGRIDEAPPVPVVEPRAGRARVAVAGADPIRPAADEPEPEDAGRDHDPRRAAATDHRSAGAAPGRRRAGDPEDDRRWAGKSEDDRRRAGDPADDRRSAEPAEDDHRRVGEPQGGRRRADDPEDGRRRSAEPATGRRRAPEPDGEPYRDHRPAEDWYADRESATRPHATPGYAAERAAGGVYGGPPRSDGHEVRPGTAPGPEVPPRPVGVVRHTETVHVTTRHTIVDGTAPDPGPGDGYSRWTPPEEQSWTGHGGPERDRWDGYPPREDHARPGRPRGSARPGPPPVHHDRSWDTPPAGPRPAGARSWSGPDDRSGPDGSRDWPGHGGGPDPDWRTPAGGRYAGADERYAAGGERTGPAGGDSRSRRGAAERVSGRAYPPADAGADDWSEVSAGGRWATVRDDEHGRELRMGERRAAVHADGDGTEMRVEDHWAAVRRPRRGHPDDGYDRDEGRGAGPEYPRRDGHRPEPDRALPPGGVPVPEQWRPSGGRGADGWSTPRGAEPAPGWSTPPAEPEWSPPRDRRPAGDWPEPSSRGRRSEPDPDRYGRSARERGGRADDSPERWR
ncbi:hypothetical protein ACIBCR_22140 [Micromonospora echinospora]|uniref:hypothetical protein n=1 Tax=Micromonospora echinospora TaxID=1877 RepID=UPI0037A9CE21